jgi:hypothetical protein
VDAVPAAFAEPHPVQREALAQPVTSRDPGNGTVTKQGHNDTVNRLLASCTRYLGAATAVSALCVLWAISTRSLLSAPLAVVFVGITFWWSITRLEPAFLRPVTADGRCGGCVAGCAECRERIDVQ